RRRALRKVAARLRLDPRPPCRARRSPPAATGDARDQPRGDHQTSRREWTHPGRDHRGGHRFGRIGRLIGVASTLVRMIAIDAGFRLRAVVARAAPSTMAVLLRPLVPAAAQATGKPCAAAARRLSASVEQSSSPQPAESVPTVRSGFGRADTDRPAIYVPALR